jgi:hypothetical protein
MKLRNVFPTLVILTVALLAGCKQDQEPGVRPRILSTDPISNATGISINNKISVTFTEAMDPSTITESKFILLQGTTNVAGTVSYEGTTAVFKPAANLTPSTLYTAKVTTGARSASGQSLAKEYIWSFTTGAIPDTTLPIVTLSNPADLSLDVTLDHTIIATFSEAMDQTTINAFSFTVKQGLTPVSGAVTYTGTTATFTPTNKLSNNKLYTVTITKAVKDMAGNALAANYTVKFTTIERSDIVKPVVSSTDPLNNALGVAGNHTVAAVFSERMDSLSITSSTFTLKKGTTAVSGTITYSGTTAVFTPLVSLEASTVYTASITTGVKDLAGNALASSTSWSFTTLAAPDTSLPMVNATDPLNNAIEVPLNKAITVMFSEDMDPLTITNATFTLDASGVAVSGSVVYANKTATFTPSANLATGTNYTATITTGVKDLAGNALAANIVWSFATGATATSTLAVVNLGSAANYVILAKTAISNVPTSAITGALGLSPAATSYITGFALTNATGYATASQVTGKIYAADMAAPTSTNLTTAVSDMMTAYTDAAGRPTPDFLNLFTGNIGGKTLTPGLYKWTSTVTLPSNVVISGGANDVWIFQISGDLTMSSAVKITLNGGAQAKNIFWQVAGQTTVGLNAQFKGVILCMTGITFQSGATLTGRALAQTAVVLDKNTVKAE